MTTPATAEFTELRFRSNADALQVVSAIQSLVDYPLGGPMRVLVVEDHLDTATMLEELLKAWGFSAAIAHSGAEALEVAERFMPRVVLISSSR